jgi:hypothetical protein
MGPGEGKDVAINYADRDDSFYRRPVGSTPACPAWKPGREPFYLSLVPVRYSPAERAEGARPGHCISYDMQAPGREGVPGHAPLPDPKGRVLHHKKMQKGRARGHRPEASEAAQRPDKRGGSKSRGELV